MKVPVPYHSPLVSAAVAVVLTAATAGSSGAEELAVEHPTPGGARNELDDAAAIVAEASLIRRFDHGGSFRNGEFRRSVTRYGVAATALEHDRVRALCLLEPLLPRADGLPPETRAALYAELADSLLLGRDGERSWRLFSLTDLSTVPAPASDLSEKTCAAPADADGAPVLHAVPPSWEESRTDGERWRWALARLADSDSAAASRRLARFAWSQFGARTLPSSGPEELAKTTDPTDPFGLATLAPDEMIARLAPGVRRFRLPPDWNPAILLSTANDADALGRWHESRLRNDLALDVYRTDPMRFADRIAAIETPAVIVRRVPGSITPERPVAFDFAARNATRVDFEIRAFSPVGLADAVANAGFGSSVVPDVDSTLQKTHLEIETGLNGSSCAWTNNLGAVIASWSEALDPAPVGRLLSGHTSPPAPLPGGLFRLRASVPSGNEYWVVFEVVDTAILVSPPNCPSSKDPAPESGDAASPRTAGLLLADISDGHPVAGAEGRIEFFRGSENEPIPSVVVRTDSDGTASFHWPAMTENVFARGILDGPGPRHAVYFTLAPGHTSFVRPDHRLRSGPAAAIVLDRPVCPPGGTVRFKLWLSSQDATAPAWTNCSVRVGLADQRKHFLAGTIGTTDALGTLSGSFEVPEDLPSGVYWLGARTDRTGFIRLDTRLRIAAIRSPDPSDETPILAPFEPPGPVTARRHALPFSIPLVYRPSLPLYLSLNSDHYAPGDIAHVVLRANRPDSWVLVTTRAGTDRARTEWIRLRGSETAFELSLDDADRPNIFVEAVAFHDGRFLSDRVSVDLPLVEHLATVALDAPEHAAPGSRVEVLVRVADSAGHPAENASVALSICAARLFDFAPAKNNDAPPDESIWGWRNELFSHFQTNPEIGVSFSPSGWNSPLPLSGDRFACPWWAQAELNGQETLPPPGGEDQRNIPRVGPVLIAHPPEPNAVPGDPALAEPLLWLTELDPADEPGVYRAAFDLPDIPAEWTLRAFATLPGSILGHAKSILASTSSSLMTEPVN